MKLSEFIKKCKKLYPEADPEIIVIGHGIFSIKEILPRSAYLDETLYGNKLSKVGTLFIELNDEPDREYINA